MQPSIAVTIERYAQRYDFDPAALKAVAWVESAGTFYWNVNGKDEPAIRPEVHKFYQFLSGEKRDRAVREGLAHPKANGVSLPKSWEGRYNFFERMCQIDEDAAICATSWGIGQVMGFHWKFLDFGSPKELMDYARSGISGQMELMCRFIDKNPHLVMAIQQKNWKAFAQGYNGPDYAKNKYDTKLAEAYRTFAQSPVSGDVYLIQQKLKDLGFYTGNLDGIKGPMTTEAVRKFQEAAGLVVDGDVSTITVEAIDKYIAAQKSKTNRDAIPKVGAAAVAVTTIARPAVESISTGDLVDAIDQTKGVADALAKLLALFNMPTMITATILAAVVGWVLYKLLAHVGDDDHANDLHKTGS